MASGVLGRSPVYARLLRYLATATVQQKTASEIDIATDVLRKGSEFDSNQDSSVRVYVHNLRQRLDRYYEENGTENHRLQIPRGEYRIEFGDPIQSLPSQARDSTRMTWLLAGIAILLAGNLLVFAASHLRGETALTESPVWAPFLKSELPLLIVVGDYFIFGELDEHGRVTRMVREFNVNSPAELETFAEMSDARSNGYINLNLSYLPQSTAFALKDVSVCCAYEAEQASHGYSCFEPAYC